jgi:hypothetical protein
LTLESYMHFSHQLLSYKFLIVFNFFESPCIPTFMFCLFCFLCMCTSGAINLLPAEALEGSEISHIFWILCIRCFIAESITFNIGYDSDVIRFTFKCTDGWHARDILAVGHHFPLVTDVLLKNEWRRRIRQELCLSRSFLLFWPVDTFFKKYTSGLTQGWNFERNVYCVTGKFFVTFKITAWRPGGNCV